MQYIIFHTVAQTELLHPFPEPHFKTFKTLKIFLYFRIVQVSAPTKLCSKCSISLLFFLKFKSNLLMKNVFFLLNAALPNPRFNSTLKACIICYQGTQTVEIIDILQFLSVTQPKPSPQTICTTDTKTYLRQSPIHRVLTIATQANENLQNKTSTVSAA